MRLINKFLIAGLISLQLNAVEDNTININFKDLKVMDLVKITSKVIDKNILITEEIKGNVEFISNKPVNKDELIKILGFVLEDKGYSLVQSNDMLRVVKLNGGTNSNVPVANLSPKDDLYWMVTEVFTVKDTDVDYVASKIRHLISKDAKMVTNKDSNALVITDFKDNIATVKDVVNIMTSGANKDTVIVELKNIDALEAKKNLEAIAKSKFNEKVETQKVSIVENRDNNSLVIIGEKGNINYLARYIKNVDTDSSLIKKESKVFSLKNVEAINVIKILDSVIGKKTYTDPNRKPLVSVDEESNAIVVMGLSDEIEIIGALVAELDKEKGQVYVQARIIEVNDELVDRIGVQYGIFGGTAGSNGLATFSSSLNNGVVPNLAEIKKSNGLNIPDIKSGLALGATLNLLKQNGALDIVSEPSILAVNNKESSIYVGEKISIKTSTTIGQSTTSIDRNNYSREDVGLTLKVKPRISSEEKVTLEISTLLEGIKATQTISGNPDTLKKEIKTTAILNNGESVIIGGLIENKNETTNQKVPVLGDIPVMGNLFRNDSTTTTKKNLVVIVTPYMIPKTKDITYVRNELAELKSMEDKYLEDSLIRLKEDSLKKKVEAKKREEKINELNKELNKYEADKEENKIDHNKRVNEILGQ